MRLCLPLVFAAGVLLAQQRQREIQPPVNLEAAAAGAKLFATACGDCHGAHGEGGRGPNLATGRMMRRGGSQQIATIVRNGIAGTEMPGFRSLSDEKLAQIVAFVRSLSAPAVEAPPPGDSEAGRVLFYGNAGCSHCHRIRGQGGFLGPDLSNAGLTHSAKQLRDALLDPKSRSRSGYEGVTVTTKSGQTITGVARNHTNYSIQVLDAQGRLHLLEAEDLRNAVWSQGDVMPDYSARLTEADAENVLAYLSRQSTRTPGEAIASRRMP